MKIYLLFLTLLIGVLLTLHLSMNAQVGVLIKDAKMGNAIFWTIGGITAIIIGLSSWDMTALSSLKEVPLWLLTAGMIGACLVFGIAWVIPQIGAGTAFVLMIAGQVIAGMIFSHFGVLGSPVDRISLMKVLGVLLLVGGAGIVTFSK
jgi:transporter family-2 protein